MRLSFSCRGADRLPAGGISEIAVNSALALIEVAQPRDEIEAALALQMAWVHIAAMAILSRLEGGFSTERRTEAQPRSAHLEGHALVRA